MVEEKREGVPFRANIFPASSDSRVDVDKFRADFLRLDLWQGLEIIDRSQAGVGNDHQTASSYKTEEEIITSISMADSFDDYRPCRPQDFIGRLDLQKKFGTS